MSELAQSPFNEPSKSREIEVPKDKNSLFWAVALAYLIHVKYNENLLEERFKKLFGEESLDKLGQVKALIKGYDPFSADQVIYNDKTLKNLVQERFRSRIAKHMTSSGVVTQEADLLAISELLACRLQIITPEGERSFGEGITIRLFHLEASRRDTGVDHYRFAEIISDSYPHINQKSLSRKKRYDSPEYPQAVTSGASNKGKLSEQEVQQKTEYPKEHPTSEGKNTFHGNVYQLDLLTLFLVQGMKEGHDFRLATEMAFAGKFDDLFFRYKEGKEWKYRLLQAKHTQVENEEIKKITASNLLTQSDGPYSLRKYFISYLEIKRKFREENEIFRGEFDKALKDFIICTNIDFDFDNSTQNGISKKLKLKDSSIEIQPIERASDIFDVEKGTSYRLANYGLAHLYALSENDDKNEVAGMIQSLMDTSEKNRLAVILARQILKGKITFKGKEDGIRLLKQYHLALSKEAIEVKNDSSKKQGVFNATFIRKSNNKFKKALEKAIKKELGPKMKIEDFWDKEFELPESFGKEFKLEKAFNKELEKVNEASLPNDEVTNDDIKKFFKKLTFAVNQPSGAQLEKIIKFKIRNSEMFKNYELSRTESALYLSSIRSYMINWMADKKGRFLSRKDGEDFFKGLKRKIDKIKRSGVEELSERQEKLEKRQEKLEKSPKITREELNFLKMLVDERQVSSGLSNVQQGDASTIAQEREETAQGRLLHRVTEKGNLETVNIIIKDIYKKIFHQLRRLINDRTNSDLIPLSLLDNNDISYNIDKLLGYIDSEYPDISDSYSEELIKTKKRYFSHLNAKDSNGMTPLHLAARANHLDIVLALLKHGAKYDAPDKENKRPIDFSQETSQVRELLNTIHALFRCARDNDPRIDNELADNIVSLQELNIIDGVYNSEGETLLQTASENNSLKIVDALVNHGGNSFGITANPGNTPLHLAAQSGALEVTHTLLNHVKKKYPKRLIRFVNAKGEKGFNPLHYAALNGYNSIVKALLDQGADIKAKSNFENTPLHLAVENAHLDVVSTLLDYNKESFSETSEFIHAKNKDGLTAMHIVSGRGHLEIVKALFEYVAADPDELGKLVNAKDKGGLTPLHYALHNEHISIARALVSAGADLKAKSDFKNTALHIAAISDSVEMIKELLLEIRRDLDALKRLILERDASGKTVLHLAAILGHSETIKALLEDLPTEIKQELILATDENGNTASDLAANQYHLEIAQMLLVEQTKGSDELTPKSIATDPPEEKPSDSEGKESPPRKKPRVESPDMEPTARVVSERELLEKTSLSLPVFFEDQGLWEVNVPSDNNCLFWAAALAYLIPVKDDENAFEQRFKKLSGKKSLEKLEDVKDSIKAYNPFSAEANTHQQDGHLKDLVSRVLRRRVINYIEDHESLFKDHIEGDFEKYVLKMRDPNSWGGEPEIRAMSDLLDCSIKVILLEGAPVSYGEQSTLIRLFHVGTLTGSLEANHYRFALEKDLGDSLKARATRKRPIEEIKGQTQKKPPAKTAKRLKSSQKASAVTRRKKPKLTSSSQDEPKVESPIQWSSFDKITAFQAAVKGGNDGMVDSLWNKATPEQRQAMWNSVDNETLIAAFQAAVKGNNPWMVESLWDKASAEQQQAMLSANNYNAFQAAVKGNNPWIVESLWDKASAEQQQAMWKSIDDETLIAAFQAAVKGNDHWMVESLWNKASAKQQQAMWKSIDDETLIAAFQVAVKGDNHLMVDYLWNKAAPEQQKAMWKAVDAIAIFQEAVKGGNDGMVDSLWNKAAPEQQKAMWKGVDAIAIFQAAVKRFDDSMVESLWDKASPEQQKAMWNSIDAIAAFQAAVKHGSSRVVHGLWNKATPEQQQSMLSADNYAAFQVAVKRGSSRVVDSLWNKTTPEQRQAMLSADNYDAFQVAVKRGSSSVVDSLWNKAAEEQRKAMWNSIDAIAAFQAAVKGGNDGMVDSLLNKTTPEQLQAMLSYNNYAAFQDAVKRSKATMVNSLWNKAAPEQKQEMLNTIDDEQLVKIFQRVVSARKKNLELACMILNKVTSAQRQTLWRSINPSTFVNYQESPSKNTPLHLAAQWGYLEVAQLLLDNGAQIDVKNEQGLTPLHRAASNSHKELLEKLLNRGAQSEAKDKGGRSPLHWAAYNGHKEVVELLLNRNANIEAKTNQDATPLHWAAYNGHKEVVEVLLNRNANIEAKTNQDATPLHWAVARGHLNTVKYLIDEKKADFTLKDNYCRTLLHRAARKGHLDTIKYLIDEKNADFTAKDNNGETPLHLAASEGHLEVIKYLLEKGTDLAAVNNDGHSAFELARENNHADIAELLSSHIVPIEFHRSQQKAFLRISRWIGKQLPQAALTSVKQGLYLPAFDKRRVKIKGKCAAITRAFSQVLFLKSQEGFLENLKTSAELYERIAQGKALSTKEERQLFALSKLLDSFEKEPKNPQHSLPTSLCHEISALASAALPAYMKGLEKDFALHLVLDHHVIAIYRVGNTYAYFDSNVAFVSGLNTSDELIQVLTRAINSAGYSLVEAGFSVERFDAERANRALSSAQKRTLSHPIETEQYRLALQDEQKGPLTLNDQTLSRVILYDMGARLELEGSAPLLINADMSLNDENLSAYLQAGKLLIKAKDALESLQGYSSDKALSIVKTTTELPLEGSASERALLSALRSLAHQGVSHGLNAYRINRLLKAPSAHLPFELQTLKSPLWPGRLTNAAGRISLFHGGYSSLQALRYGDTKGFALGVGEMSFSFLSQLIEDGIVKVTPSLIKQMKYGVHFSRGFAGLITSPFDLYDLIQSSIEASHAAAGSKEWRDSIAGASFAGASVVSAIAFTALGQPGAGTLVGLGIILGQGLYGGVSQIIEYKPYKLTVDEEFRLFWHSFALQLPPDDIQSLQARKNVSDELAKKSWEAIKSQEEITAYACALGKISLQDAPKEDTPGEQGLSLFDYSGLGLSTERLDLSDLQIRPKSVELSPDEAILLGSLSSLKGSEYKRFLSRALPKLPDELAFALGLPAFSDQAYERDYTLGEEGALYGSSDTAVHYCENALILGHKERMEKEEQSIKKILFDLSLVNYGLIVGHDRWQNLFLISSGSAAVLGAEQGENVFVLSDPGFSGTLVGGKDSGNLLDLRSLNSYSVKLGSCKDFDRFAYVKDWFIQKGAPGATTQSPALPSGIYGMNEVSLSAGTTLEGRAEGVRFIVEPKPGVSRVNLQAKECRLVFPKTDLLSEADIVYDKKTNVLSIKIKPDEGDFTLQIEHYLDEESGLPAYDLTDCHSSVLTPLLDAKALGSNDPIEKPSFALRHESSLDKKASIAWYDETLIKGSRYRVYGVIDLPSDQKLLLGSGADDALPLEQGVIYARGGAGGNLYTLIPHKSETPIVIDNYDKELRRDLLYIPSSRPVALSRAGDDLRIRVLVQGDEPALPELLVKNWFLSQEYRHLALIDDQKNTFMPFLQGEILELIPFYPATSKGASFVLPAETSKAVMEASLESLLCYRDKNHLYLTSEHHEASLNLELKDFFDGSNEWSHFSLYLFDDSSKDVPYRIEYPQLRELAKLAIERSVLAEDREKIKRYPLSLNDLPLELAHNQTLVNGAYRLIEPGNRKAGLLEFQGIEPAALSINEQGRDWVLTHLPSGKSCTLKNWSNPACHISALRFDGVDTLEGLDTLSDTSELESRLKGLALRRVIDAQGEELIDEIRYALAKALIKESLEKDLKISYVPLGFDSSGDLLAFLRAYRADKPDHGSSLKENPKAALALACVLTRAYCSLILGGEKRDEIKQEYTQSLSLFIDTSLVDDLIELISKAAEEGNFEAVKSFAIAKEQELLKLPV